MEKQTGEVIEQIGIEEALAERFGAYSKYVIQDRAISDIRDGLKPVQRRILYSMHEDGNNYNKATRKSAVPVSNTMGRYHPHGDSATYGALVTMGQTWITGVPLVEIQGNKGSIDGDTPASMRYTETRLTKIVSEAMMPGVDKEGVVPKVKNYDDTLEEPTVLPVQFPTLLLQGSSGVAVGYATKSIPHNLTEVLKASIALMENEDLTTEELMSIIPAPDLPTGAVIVGAKNLTNVYETGKGRIQIRGKYRIEEDKKRTYIIFSEIPYDVKKTDIINELDKLVDEKKLDGLIDARDESDRKEGVRVVLELRKDVAVNVVLGYVFKNTKLQSNFNLNMVVIKDKKPKLVGIKEILVTFNEFRKETRRRELEYDKGRLIKRLHIVEGFIKLTDIISEVVEVIKKANGKADARKKLSKKFGFTEEQSEAIVSLQLHRISRTDKKEYKEEEKKLNRQLKLIEKLLTNKKFFNESIIRGYEKLIEEFGEERKTEVIMEEEDWTVRKVDTVAEEDTVVGVSAEGYIKRSSTRSFNSTTSPGLVDGDSELAVCHSTTKEFLLLFTNKNNYLYIPVHEIEEVRWGDTGKHIASYVELGSGEKIVSAFTVSEDDNDKYVLIAKTNGQVKRTEVGQYVVTRRFWNTYEAISCRSTEELAGAWLVEDEGYIGFADSKGKKMYFNIEEIAPKGLKTMGMRGIHLDDKNDERISEVFYEVDEEKIREEYKYRPRGQKGWA